MPYIYSTFVRARRREPIQRPLVYDFQDDRHARETDDAYLFGDALLIAPVLEPGRDRAARLPSEGDVGDWATGELHPGGQFITPAAPLDRIPTFARGGRVIPMYPTAPPSTMDYYPDVLELHVVIPEEDGEYLSQLHEDDGISDAHVQGRFLRTAFSLVRKRDRVRLATKVTGGGFPEFRRRRFHLVFRGATVEKVEVNGTETRARGGRLELENSGETFELSFTV